MITGSETVHLIGRSAPVTIEGRLPLLDASDVLELGLRDGQIVRPTIEAMGGRVQLLLQGRTWDLSAVWQSLTGQVLALEVHRLPSGGAQLRPIAAGGASRTSPSAPESALGSASPESTASIRTSQLADRPLSLHAWSAMLRPGDLARLASAISPSQTGLRQDLERLTTGLPRLQTLNAQTLRQAVLDSSLFMEARLVAGQASAEASDLKSLLRRSLEHLDTDRGDWGGRIASALDDIEAAQLQSSDAIQPRESWLNLVLGFRDHPAIRMRLDRPAPGVETSAKKPWVVHVHSDTPRMGELWLRTVIHDMNRVDLTVWARRADVVEPIRQGLGNLRTELVVLGIQPGVFEVLEGEPPAPERVSAPRALGRVLDLRA
jgi:hypothetical protein